MQLFVHATAIWMKSGYSGDTINASPPAALDRYSFTRDVYLQVRSHAGEAQSADGDDDGGASNGVLPEEPAR